MINSLIGLICIIILCYLRQIKINRKLKKQLDKSLQYIENSDKNKLELEKQKEHFIEVLLHDLKTPTLAQLRGLELLTDKMFGELSEEQTYMISEIKKSCQYTLDMIGMVLNVYRLKDGQKELKYERFNLTEVIKECFISTSTEEHGLYELESNFDGDIRADKQEIKKVIQRLLESALTYSDKETPIKIELESNNLQIKVSITTTGIGLSEKDCKDIFNKYGDGGLQFSTIGHGIGLYMSKKIINLHNGEIFAQTDGKTSNTFSFIIPIHKPLPHYKKGLSNISPQFSY